MSLVKYEGVRSDGNFFLVKPGHEVPDIEDVIDRHEEYVVVAKRGAGGVSRGQKKSTLGKRHTQVTSGS